MKKVASHADIVKKEDVQERRDYLCSCFLFWQSAFCAFFGTCLVFAPHMILHLLLNTSYDGVHLHMARCIGGVLAGQSLVALLYMVSRDVACSSSLMTNRLLVSILTIAVCYNALSEDANGMFNRTAFTVLLVIFFCDVCLCTVLLILRRCPVGVALLNPQRHLIMSLTYLDFIAALAIGSVWYSMPTFILHRQVQVDLNVSHVFISRLFGAYLLGTGIISYSSMYFKKEEDRRVCVYSRCLTCACILLGQIYSQVAYGDWWNGSHWVGIALFSIWTGMAVFVFVAEACRSPGTSPVATAQ